MTAPTPPPADDQVRDVLARVIPHEGYCALWMARGKPCQCSQRGKTLTDLTAAVSALLAEARADGEAAAAEALFDAAQQIRRVADSFARRGAERQYRADQALAAIRQTEGNNR